MKTTLRKWSKACVTIMIKIKVKDVSNNGLIDSKFF